MVDNTSASSGEITSSRSASVFDGVICSSGISSPVAGSRYWIRLWCDSSVSSSIRIPVWRSTSTTAQVQNPRCSSKLRSRRRPVSGSSAHRRPVVSVFITDRRKVTPAEVNGSPGRACSAAASSSAVRVRSAATQETSAGSTGSRSRVRASMRDLRL